MLGIDRWRKISKTLIASLIAVVLAVSLASCNSNTFKSDSILRAVSQTSSRSNSAQLSGNIAEVSPPEVIQQLSQVLESYKPQVGILTPQAGEILTDTTVTVKFQVQDLPIFKNPELNLGPHLHAILDNQPYIPIYDLNQPLVLSDLAPGTHTLRVFASRPWHESFKNEGAYAQTTFHILTKTEDNNPEPDKPLLTYSRPTGSYGAEPILLDFYLTNAPLRLVTEENSKDKVADWRIRCTINGNSFVLERWQSIYLKGFKPGKNWVQLEFLDEKGNSVKNVFNNTVRLITYEPKGKDTLSKLIRGELSAADARGIVVPNYTAKVESPESKVESPESKVESPKSKVETPESKVETPEPKVETPESKVESESSPTAKVETPESKVETPESKVETSESKVESEPSPTAKAEPKKPGGYFSRFRRPSVTPSPSVEPTLPEVIETPTPELTTPEVTIPQPTPEESTPELKLAPSATEQLKEPDHQRFSQYLNRLRRPTATPSPTLPPTLPEIINPSGSKVVEPEAINQPESATQQK